MYTQEVKNKINGLGERKIINTFFVYLKIIYLHPPLLPTGSRFLPIDRYTRTAAFEVTNDLYFFRRAALRSIRSLSFGLCTVSFFLFFVTFLEEKGREDGLFGEERVGTAVEGRIKLCFTPPFSFIV
jgi:hypothetical protein